MRTGQLLAIFDPINRATTICPDEPHIGRESQARQKGHCGQWHAIRWTFHLTRRGQGNKDTDEQHPPPLTQLSPRSYVLSSVECPGSISCVSGDNSSIRAMKNGVKLITDLSTIRLRWGCPSNIMTFKLRDANVHSPRASCDSEWQM